MIKWLPTSIILFQLTTMKFRKRFKDLSTTSKWSHSGYLLCHASYFPSLPEPFLMSSEENRFCFSPSLETLLECSSTWSTMHSSKHFPLNSSMWTILPLSLEEAPSTTWVCTATEQQWQNQRSELIAWRVLTELKHLPMLWALCFLHLSSDSLATLAIMPSVQYFLLSLLPT